MGAVEDGICNGLESTTSSILFSSIVHIGIPPHFLDQLRSITSHGFVLNIIKGHYLQLWCHHQLFCNFKWFNIQAPKAHCPVIQKEVK